MFEHPEGRIAPGLLGSFFLNELFRLRDKSSFQKPEHNGQGPQGRQAVMGFFQLGSDSCDRAEEPLLVSDEQVMPLLELDDSALAGADLQTILEQAFKPGQVGFQGAELLP
jgi:hypothetical protein